MIDSKHDTMEPANVSPEDQPIEQPETGGDAAAAAGERDLEQLRQELVEAQNQTLRAQAELENFRRRMRREMEEERRFATAPLLRDLLPVLDNLHRAIEAASKTDAANDLVNGVRMVVQQVEQVLDQHGCRRIPTAGEMFDPHRHEALAQQPSDAQPSGAILFETQSGYELHERVLRPSQVFVSSGPAADAKQEGQSE